MLQLISILAIFNCLALPATDYHADTIAIASLILNEPRDIVIYEPVGIHEKESVRIVYLLDGEFSKYRYEKISQEHFDKAHSWHRHHQHQSEQGHAAGEGTLLTFNHLQWKNEMNEGENHNTNDIVTLIKGLH